MANLSVSQNTNAPDEKLECEDCEKKFSGLESWEQHVKSEKHKKKVVLRVSLTKNCGSGITNAGNSASTSIECHNCGVFCNSQVTFEEHLKSKNHEKAVNARSNWIRSKEAGSTMKAVQLLECLPCQKSFSGKESWEEHLKSSKHQKKVCAITPSESSKNTAVKTAPVVGNDTKVEQEYDCKFCHISCSGPASYKEHLDSAKHLKKIAVAAAIDGGQTASSSTGMIKCHVCDIECSGEKNFKQHENSDKHKKKLLKL